MQKRRLGQLPIEVSAIGLGTVKFGRNQGVKYPDAFALPTDAEITTLLGVAQDLGINLLDTAPAYGFSEERLGKLLGNRHDWVISTKVGETFQDGQSQFDFSPAAVRLSVERSLKRLRTDYLDIVLVHSDGEDERIIQEEDIFNTLQTLRTEGKICGYGMSTKTIAGGKLAVTNSDVVMVTYNPAYPEDKEVIAKAHAQSKAIFIKKAFASGHFQGLNTKDPIKETMQFIFTTPGITSVIVGTLNPTHLRQNAAALPPPPGGISLSE